MRVKAKSVTRILFMTTQLAALAWVSVSYLIAIYATVKLAQPFPVVELSQQAITTILGVSALKVDGKHFEHNEGVVLAKAGSRMIRPMRARKKEVSDDHGNQTKAVSSPWSPWS